MTQLPVDFFFSSLENIPLEWNSKGKKKKHLATMRDNENLYLKA